MTKKIIFQDTFLVAGIMCHVGCGATIQGFLTDCVEECKDVALLPKDAELILDAEPEALGIHRLLIMIKSEDQAFNQQKDQNRLLYSKLKEAICFEVIDTETTTQKEESNHINWLNILVNVLAIGLILVLSIVFAPSWPLTIGLTLLSIVTTAFTARNYLFHFIQNIANKKWVNMTTTISLGWLLSVTHTLYHAIDMPLACGFSMIFMSFIMPVVLMALINGMDEIKRLVLNKSKKMHLQGIKTLFPQMAETYLCYQQSQQEQAALFELSEYLSHLKEDALPNLNVFLHPMDELLSHPIQDILDNNNVFIEKKNSLKNGMIIQIKQGSCFPVDCILIHGNTLVDSSLITGEPQEGKKRLDFVRAGAINLGPTVIVYAAKDTYNSTINKLLFCANRAKENKVVNAHGKFIYFYTALIFVGVIASVLIPFALGILTVPLLLQNVTGILFAVCSCTIVIAHQLPNLLSMYQRTKEGILLRDEDLIVQCEEPHTIVFDKTGTLTTGNSQVASIVGISASLWERVYLLEVHSGEGHPLAKAIITNYEATTTNKIFIKDIKKISIDSDHRGLSAVVQGVQIHIGNAAYLNHAGIALDIPINLQKHVNAQMAKGFSPVYVAEGRVFQGVIFIKHEIRKGVLPALARLKKEGKRIIMLTGDNAQSAMGFDQQNGHIFGEANIFSGQTPQDKEAFLTNLMDSKNKTRADSNGVWFVGDGLNDSLCARVVTKNGGVSCAMTSNDKAAFFTDLSLDGSLDYLFKHNKLNRFLKKNVFQNQGLLSYGAIIMLAFIIAFSIAGSAVSPLIPLIIMVSTTLFILFNTYRVSLSVTNTLSKTPSWMRWFLASDLSIGLLVGLSMLLSCGLLISIGATGGLVWPTLVFSAGIEAMMVSSACLLSAVGLCGLFVILVVSCYVLDAYVASEVEEDRNLMGYEPTKRAASGPSYIRPSNQPPDVPRRDREIQGSRTGIRFLDPMVKPRSIGRAELPGDYDRTQPSNTPVF